MTRISVLLLSTFWTPTLENCLATLRKNGFSYRVIEHGSLWKGWKWRSECYLRELKAMDASDIVVVMDAHDTLCQRNSSFLIENFKAHESPIVIGCEWYCGNSKNCDDVNWWKNKNFKSLPFRKFVNAGCIIGNVKALQDMYEWMFACSKEDDQLALASWVNTFPEKCSLDYGCDLIYTSNVFDCGKTPATRHTPLHVFTVYSTVYILYIRGSQTHTVDISKLSFLVTAQAYCTSIYAGMW